MPNDLILGFPVIGIIGENHRCPIDKPLLGNLFAPSLFEYCLQVLPRDANAGLRASAVKVEPSHLWAAV
ncbi:MAG: hypothetical protein DMG96_16765 [Acidobacteria bacterium]|nr:MAG: hypothetical protein DMG96_16765 [Acidobacteriota bacterium]